MATTYDIITSQTLGSAVSSVSFTSLTQAYTDLRIEFSGSVTTGFVTINLQFNGDTATNYSRVWLSGDGTSNTTTLASNQTALILGAMGTDQSISDFKVQGYSKTTIYKTALGHGYTPANIARMSVGTWRSTSAITQIDIIAASSTFTVGSKFTIYGILAA